MTRRREVRRCEPCLGMGYKGRTERGKWKIRTCPACGGTGQKAYIIRRKETATK